MQKFLNAYFKIVHKIRNYFVDVSMCACACARIKSSSPTAFRLQIFIYGFSSQWLIFTNIVASHMCRNINADNEMARICVPFLYNFVVVVVRCVCVYQL